MLEANADEVVVYQTVYSWRLAHHILEQDGRSPLGLGSLACAMILRQSTKTLWTRRAETVAINPGRWTVSVNGGVHPDETVAEAVLRETTEELGVRADQLVDLSLRALLLGPDPIGCLFVYGAGLRSNVDLHYDESETSALCWAETPSDLKGPLVPFAAEIWRAGRMGLT